MSMQKLFVAAAAASLMFACGTKHQVDWKDTGVKNANETDASMAKTAEQEGDDLWKQRGDKEKLKAAIAKWEEAAAKSPNAELAAKLARAHYFLGDGYMVLEGNTEGRDAEYQLGLNWATTSLKLSAPAFAAAMAEGKKHSEAITLAPKEAVPAMYWYATNLGKWAASKGFTTRLKYKDDIKATMDHVKSLDENYFYAAPWRYFGGFEALTAGLAGGDLAKSKVNFETSVQKAPNYFGTKVLWADLLCTRTQDKDTYKKLLEEVINGDPKVDPEIEPENRVEQEKAKKLLAQIDDKF